MMCDDEDDTPREIGKAVVIAGLTVLVTKLVEWGVDELRARLKPEAERPRDRDVKPPN